MTLAEFVPNAGPGGLRRIYVDHRRGGFKSSDHKHWDKLEGVLLGVISTRKLWPMVEQGQERTKVISELGVLCKSPDNQRGHPNENFVEHGLKGSVGESRWADEAKVYIATDEPLVCSSCPLKEYSTRRPVCKPSYYVPIVDPDTLELSVLELSQAGVKASANIFKQILFLEKKQLFQYSWVIGTTISDKGNSRFATPTYENSPISIPDDSWDYYVTQFNETREKILEDFNRVYTPTMPKPTIQPMTPQ